VVCEEQARGRTCLSAGLPRPVRQPSTSSTPTDATPAGSILRGGDRPRLTREEEAGVLHATTTTPRSMVWRWWATFARPRARLVAGELSAGDLGPPVRGPGGRAKGAGAAGHNTRSGTTTTGCLPQTSPNPLVFPHRVGHARDVGRWDALASAAPAQTRRPAWLEVKRRLVPVQRGQLLPYTRPKDPGLFTTRWRSLHRPAAAALEPR